jgi:hypothetical protein
VRDEGKEHSAVGGDLSHWHGKNRCFLRQLFDLQRQQTSADQDWRLLVAKSSHLSPAAQLNAS